MGKDESKPLETVEEFPKPVITAKTVTERYDLGLQAILFERREYWLNFAFLQGRQWIYWNRETKRFDDLPRYSGRYQATIDRTTPASRTIMAKLMQRDLTFDVPPTGADSDSMEGAKIAKSAVSQVHDEHDWEVLREDWYWATWTGGTAAVCVDYDPDRGDYLGDNVYTGETCETVLTIPEFVIEPGARSSEKARWWIKAVILPPETAQAIYGLKNTPPADAMSAQSPYNQRTIVSEMQTLDRIDGTLVLTYYERPNPLNRTGAIATVIDGKLATEVKAWPFPFKDRLNISVARETPVNGKWTGATTLSRARDVQVAINAAWSNYLEHLKKVGNARLMIPMSQMEMADVLSDDPGKPIKFMDGPGAVMPKYLEPPQLPAWVIQSIERLEGEMDDILGLHAISRGTAPTNAPDSGYGLSILAENDNTPVGRMSKEFARAWGNVATMVLQILERNTSTKKKSIIRMPSGTPQTVEWVGRDLAGQTRAIVPPDSVAPRSRAQLLQFAQSLVQMGMIQPGNFAQFAEIADLPDAQDILWAVDEQTAKARRYNHLMAEGIMMVPVERDDHSVFIKEINRFRQTPKFDSLAEDIQNLFEVNIQGHQRLAEEQMGQQVAKGHFNPALAAVPTASGAPQLPLSVAGGLPAEGPSPEMPAGPESPVMPQSEGF